MALNLGMSTDPGADLFATLERLDTGFFWNRAATAWQANPSTADRKIDMLEGTGINAGSYTASVTGLGDAGLVRIRVHNDASAADSVISGGQVYVWGGNEIGAGELVSIQSHTGLITAGRVVVVSPVADGGDITLVRGDAYTVRLGRPLEWVDNLGGWPTLTDAVITLEVGDGEMVVVGTVVEATGDTKTVRVEPKSSETAELTEEKYDMRVVASFPGTGTTSGETDRVTLVSGTCTVVDREDT